jgi:Flp pilus assembly pilin Flp
MHWQFDIRTSAMRELIAVGAGFLTDESAATMLEYVLMAGLIAVVAAVGAGAVGTSLAGAFTRFAGQV